MWLQAAIVPKQLDTIVTRPDSPAAERPVTWWDVATVLTAAQNDIHNNIL
mgnify:CR=1 FL=1